MTNPVIQMAVTDLTEQQAQNKDLIVLDVREPWELELASVAGTVNIAMHLVPLRIDELPKDKKIVVMCHHGGRSQQVAQYLSHHGYDQVYNLTGGIHAWSQHIDPIIPQY